MKNIKHMNTISNITKRPYIVPELEIIKLDNEISLAMESTPPHPKEKVKPMLLSL